MLLQERRLATNTTTNAGRFIAGSKFSEATLFPPAFQPASSPSDSPANRHPIKPV